MDGTASLSYLLSSLEAEGHQAGTLLDSEGALVRNNPAEKKVYLIFFSSRIIRRRKNNSSDTQ